MAGIPPCELLGSEDGSCTFVACAPKTATVPNGQSALCRWLVQVHVQVQAFLQACLKTMPGERGGSIVGPFWGNFGTILGAFCSILHARGTIFGALGTCFETPFPRFGQMLDFGRKPAEKLPRGIPFLTKIVTVASRSPPRADFFRKRATFVIPHYLRYFSGVRPPLGAPSGLPGGYPFRPGIN